MPARPATRSQDGANIDLDAHRKGKCCVLKTSTRQTIFLPVPGLVDPDKLKPADLVGVNKDSYLILEALPAEFDSRVKAMEVDEKPTEQFNDVGGLEAQIQELIEAIVLPMTHKERFDNIGIKPPKGALMYGPPGTGKTLIARACAAQTNACFLKLAGPQLVQMFIGDGAKLVRDAFALAKEKQPAIIFIDELDAIGTKRFDSELSGDREVQRTMLELLNQLDGFTSNEAIKIIAATNRVDILDPALLRSGRIDRKIEFPLPNEEGRAHILQIHSRKMNVNSEVNFEELGRCTGARVAGPEPDADHWGGGGAWSLLLNPSPTLVTGVGSLGWCLSRASLLSLVAPRGPHLISPFLPCPSARPDDFNGAQLKAVCVEAGMIALRNERTEIVHEDFMEGLTVVQAKKKATLSYYA